VIQWLRARLLAGFFIMVPLLVSLAALYWIFSIIDRFTATLAGEQAGPATRAAVAALGIITTMLVVLTVGAVATNVIGRRVLNRAESWLMMIPVFRIIYAPVKQLVVAFSPDNEYGFKRVVLVEDSARRWVMGFLTKEFTINRGQGPERLIAVYVPTNHLYIGDVVIFPRERAVFPDLDVEEGIRIFLTGGMSLPGALGTRPESGKPA
jgi:uncharacterized membrane protein